MANIPSICYFCKKIVMQIFYCISREADLFYLDRNESWHLCRVLRLQNDDHANVIDGTGFLYTCEVTKSDPNSSVLSIIKKELDNSKRDYKITIAIAPTKNNDRLEWFIEKSVEIGVDVISPIICERSERKVYKTERARRIVISAMKQSGKTQLTLIEEPIQFSDLIKMNFSGTKFIAHCQKAFQSETFSSLYTKGNDVVILIGPEGDFTKSEINNAKDNGFIELSLGKSRLRSETAGLVACSFAYFLNN